MLQALRFWSTPMGFEILWPVDFVSKFFKFWSTPMGFEINIPEDLQLLKLLFWSTPMGFEIVTGVFSVNELGVLKYPYGIWN